MKKADTRLTDECRYQKQEIRMMCGKMLCDGIPNGLLRDRTRVEDIG